jgi:hypothetical protein
MELHGLISLQNDEAQGLMTDLTSIVRATATMERCRRRT